MRNHIVGLIHAAAQSNPELVFLTGDLGFSVVEPLEASMGARFINAGIAEANMVSMASSLSACGFEPYVYSITPFVTLRVLEQVRNDICYQNAAVRLLGIGAGFSYGTLGPSHHALEDATIMATLPNMTVFSPSTRSELDRLFALSAQIDGAIYYRLGREDGPNLPAPAFSFDTPVCRWRSGSEINIVTSGSIAGEVFAAVDLLMEDGIAVNLLTLPIIAPFPWRQVTDALAAAPTLVVFEGYENNPLESGIAKVLAGAPTGRPVRFMNAGRSFAHIVGGTEFQRRAVQLDRQSIADAARAIISQ